MPTPVELAGAVGITASVADKGDYIPLFAQVFDIFGIMFTLDDVAKTLGVVLVCFLILDRVITFRKGKANDSDNSATSKSNNARDT